MATPALLTFGYEGLAIEAFIARLKTARADLVVDVRQMPLSHKKGFSKTAFHAALQAQGIDYEHLPALGCPKPVRDRYHEDGDWAAFSHGYLAHLKTQKAAVAALADTLRGRRACLVCYEADPARCHRTHVARAVAKQGGPGVIHLVGKGEVPDERLLAAQ